MTTPAVRLPGPVAVVVHSAKLEQQLARLRRQSPEAPSASTIVTELGRLAAAGTLFVRVEGRGDDRYLQAFTRLYVVGLYPTDRLTGYRLGWINRIRFLDQERLVGGALAVHGPGAWTPYLALREVPSDGSAYWHTIVEEWDALRPEHVTPALPHRHEEFMDLLTEAVEAGRAIETARVRDAPPVPYRRHDGTAARLHTARAVYAFTLPEPAALDVGALVYVGDDQELRGVVHGVRDRRVEVRFERGVDHRQIPAQGTLRIVPSTAVYRTQLEAIETLRRGRPRDRALLATLVDRAQAPYAPDRQAEPCLPLDPEQRAAFRMALAVPDCLLVLGPPGSGKTRTIAAIVDAATARGERVLVTSHTNRAVDNVLTKLPATVQAVRIGHEDRLTGDARPFLAEVQVETLRTEILDATAVNEQRLAAVAGPRSVAARLFAHLHCELDRALQADADRSRDLALRDTRATQLLGCLQPQLSAAGVALVAAQAAAERAHAVAQTATERAADLKRRSGRLAFFHRWRAGLWRARAQQRDERWQAAAGRERAAAAEWHRLDMQARAVTANDPEVVRLGGLMARAESVVVEALAEVREAAEKLVACGVPAPPVPPGPSPGLDEWVRLREALQAELELARARAELLVRWRDHVDRVDDVLQHELVRYADVVVAATCISSASSRLLEDVEFDLAVVDEAGQVSTPNLLVPLVRARRSVLVGDHRQLPPFLDHELDRWARTAASSDTLRSNLAASEFERLYPSRDTLHRIMLRTQRRMPEMLARFVSAAFYDGTLVTDHDGTAGDPLFADPFVMIDTSDQPSERRREQTVRIAGGRTSYRNVLEAELIVDLVGHHIRHYPDWAVIVPFRPQVELIVKRLQQVVGTQQAEDRVGTVDSFQGGERDLVVYGFTRSNAGGGVGFLRELRRVNVALTRARRQLVVVGDRATLRGADDPEFARLAVALTDYLAEHDAIHGSAWVRNRLRT